MHEASRRTILIAAAGAAAAGVLPALAVTSPDLDTVVVFEADEASARAFATQRNPRLAVHGDRIRFARRLFLDMRPARVLAMTRYADYLLLADAAREHGYRTSLGGTAGGVLFGWTAERSPSA